MPIQVTPRTPLAPYTTLGIGGPASELITLTDPGDFFDLVDLARAQGVTPRVIGHGSNVLVADDGVQGMVVRMATTGIQLQDGPGDAVDVTVQAGQELQSLIGQMIELGIGGMEAMSGVPGTVGATPIQNVGAYGQEVQDTITVVHAYDWQAGQLVDMDWNACAFGHRTSVFKHSARYTILSVRFRLARTDLSCPIMYRGVASCAGVKVGERTSLKEAAAAVREVRARKGMLIDPSDPDHRCVGSVFMSPVIPPAMAEQLRLEGAPVNDFPDGSTRVSASWLMKVAGYQFGDEVNAGVRISRKHHAIVATEGATAELFTQGSAIVAQRVLEATGITLTAEPDLIGCLPAYTALTGSSRASAPAGDSAN